MRALQMIRGFFAKAGDFLLKLRQDSDFTCGDCDRWERCGLPPDKNCIHRLTQIAREDGRRPIRAPMAQF